MDPPKNSRPWEPTSSALDLGGRGCVPEGRLALSSIRARCRGTGPSLFGPRVSQSSPTRKQAQEKQAPASGRRPRTVLVRGSHSTGSIGITSLLPVRGPSGLSGSAGRSVTAAERRDERPMLGRRVFRVHAFGQQDPGPVPNGWPGDSFDGIVRHQASPPGLWAEGLKVPSRSSPNPRRNIETLRFWIKKKACWKGLPRPVPARSEVIRFHPCGP